MISNCNCGRVRIPPQAGFGRYPRDGLIAGAAIAAGPRAAYLRQATMENAS